MALKSFLLLFLMLIGIKECEISAKSLNCENTYVWLKVGCDENYIPKNCNFKKIPVLTLDDFDRCGPARVSLNARHYFVGVAGDGDTFMENQNAFRRIRIVPKILRGDRKYSLKTTVLGEEIDFPVGFAPSTLHILADPEGEIATVRALAETHTVMILNCYSSVLLEDVARTNVQGKAILWMQTYIFDDNNVTLDLVRRAERSGYKAIVVTLDNPIDETKTTCNGKGGLVTPPGVSPVNIPESQYHSLYTNGTSLSFKDLKWLVSQTKLPVIAKGILSPDDAVQAVEAGVSGIIVSNQGGRNLDSEISTIDALPDIVEAVSRFDPIPEVYLDSGVRKGTDVFKALARGARMVFVGRPVLWGLAMNGTSGVKQMLTILKNELNDTMILTGSNSPSGISNDTLKTSVTACT